MSWVEETTTTEWAQARLVYAALYNLLDIARVNVQLPRRAPDGTKMPSLNQMIKSGYSVVRGLSKSELRRRWRWLCRDDPDLVVFRYLRQFDNATDTIVAICKGLKFLVTKYDVEKILATPEAELIKDRGYLGCMKSGIRDIVGKNQKGHPLSIQRASKHFAPGTRKSATPHYRGLEMYSIVVHENMLRMLPDTLDGAWHIIDFSGYSRENLDSKISKFIVQHMRYLYPGIAETTVFYNVPRIYALMWRVMKPFVAKKTLAGVKTANSLPQLVTLFEPDQLPPHIGGGSGHEFKWIPPSKADDDMLKAPHEDLKLERLNLLREFEASTRQWIESDVAVERRREIVRKLKINYKELDPYVRHRSIFDRNGIAEKFVPSYRAETKADVATTDPVANVLANMSMHETSPSMKGVGLRHSFEVPPKPKFELGSVSSVDAASVLDDRSVTDCSIAPVSLEDANMDMLPKVQAEQPKESAPWESEATHALAMAEEAFKKELEAQKAKEAAAAALRAAQEAEAHKAEAAAMAAMEAEAEAALRASQDVEARKAEVAAMAAWEAEAREARATAQAVAQTAANIATASATPPKVNAKLARTPSTTSSKVSPSAVSLSSANPSALTVIPAKTGAKANTGAKASAAIAHAGGARVQGSPTPSAERPARPAVVTESTHENRKSASPVPSSPRSEQHESDASGAHSLSSSTTVIGQLEEKIPSPITEIR